MQPTPAATSKKNAKDTKTPAVVPVIPRAPVTRPRRKAMAKVRNARPAYPGMCSFPPAAAQEMTTTMERQPRIKGITTGSFAAIAAKHSGETVAVDALARSMMEGITVKSFCFRCLLVSTRAQKLFHEYGGFDGRAAGK
jgi:hypothetical protein